ncbi:hypothetical protein [Streptomyces sp. BA2]|uniref:hypothetical protein n=1 Tax=Streptomyces sp. BA2 TaxID=436595 RepID=UPI00132B1DFF|nr:hypothetical protein [Streptomyces sp. BA2]MWA08785.1 hypothetical protein [Streptomyces sp. BA2]
MPTTPEEIAAAEAAADAKLAAVHEVMDRAKDQGPTFGGSIVHGDQYGVTGGTHYGDIHVGH